MDNRIYAKLACAKPGCRIYAMTDGSGFCYAHSPNKVEKRRESHIKRVNSIKNSPRLPERCCNREGCRGMAMRDGSGYCFYHNPSQAEKRNERALKIGASRLKNQPPPERRCTGKRCNSWALKDGSGLCWAHKPENSSNKRKRMKGNKYAKGHHTPWLGLANIDEARGLIFYSLLNDKPLLTLPALIKIASLHARGETWSAFQHSIYKVEPKEEDEDIV